MSNQLSNISIQSAVFSSWKRHLNAEAVVCEISWAARETCCLVLWVQLKWMGRSLWWILSSPESMSKIFCKFSFLISEPSWSRYPLSSKWFRSSLSRCGASAKTKTFLSGQEGLMKNGFSWDTSKLYKRLQFPRSQTMLWIWMLWFSAAIMMEKRRSFVIGESKS